MISLIQSNSKSFILHAFGIGDGVSTQLIINSATAGLGEYYFVNSLAEGLSKCVIDAIKAGSSESFHV